MQVLSAQKSATLQQQREARFNAKLRLFLERYGYRDGVAWVQWGMVGSKLQGVFGTTDRKVFDYSIDGEGLGYKPSPAIKADALNRGIRLGVRSDSRSKKKQCTSPTAYACGNACISRTKQCRIRDVGVRQVAAQLIGEARQIEVGRSGGAISEAQLQQIVDRENSKIRNLPHERGVVIDRRTGRVLVDKGGSEQEVYFTAAEVRAMKGSVVTHNHPAIGVCKDSRHPCNQGHSFSLSDLEVAATADAAEIIAVSNGYTHRVKPGKNGWNRLKIASSYRRNYNKTYNEFSYRIAFGLMSAEQAEAEFHHTVIDRTAKETGLVYRRTPVGG